MEYRIKNQYWEYAVDASGGVSSVVNCISGREYCAALGEMVRVIYQQGEHFERVLAGLEQHPEIFVKEETLTLFYPTLTGKDGTLPISLRVEITLCGKRMTVQTVLENHAPVTVTEIQITPLAGISRLGEDPKKDYLMWPRHMGQKIFDPFHSDLFCHCRGGHKYGRMEATIDALDLTYPGGLGSMQWYSLCNETEGIYVGNHDQNYRITCLHVERDVKGETLRLGVCQYPFAEQGEHFSSAPLVFELLEGDWHQGAKIYRRWMEEECGWTPPDSPSWAKEFQGWLRCIFRTQSGEHNFTFHDIPRLFDEVQAAGLNTLFVLGWTRGGFARRWPDYVIDPEQGGEEALRAGIEYVHQKGGKLVMFLSYYLIDRQSRFYREEGGNFCTTLDLWGEEAPFAEVYSREGTYRRFPAQPMPMYAACPGSDLWHEKMKQSADTCLSFGCDGVLYDLGGKTPLFCFSREHDHENPADAYASKARRYGELRENVRRHNKEAIIMQEHVVDIFARSMDVVQTSPHNPRNHTCPEMFCYTFPEIVLTNRNLAMDETNMNDHIGYSFLYNLAFDLTVHRACGSISHIPRYAEAVKKVVALRREHKEYFSYGRFVDEDGFTASSHQFRQKAYRTKEGNLGLAIWNWSAEKGSVTYTNCQSGAVQTVTLEKDEIAFLCL